MQRLAASLTYALCNTAIAKPEAPPAAFERNAGNGGYTGQVVAGDEGDGGNANEGSEPTALTSLSLSLAGSLRGNLVDLQGQEEAYRISRAVL